ncbi:hydrolase [Lactobacillus nasalidis]|uniref:Hydrolase n=1 Tax=Lactobacillus nasalidis TaxID=2797258 RepID=A0ABQ3W4E3_9LACO|nr:NlpC/P60 family protein [Lactobacillus nasalidis]GHV98470.1 hydrolase [Lactobacillus nasalidis]GHV99181.1 hydrolase [Lactobacillus nasalidis]GHW01271.1 hydrolase [Lactobacillus nasalidis]
MKKSNLIKFSAAALTFLGISATGVKPVKGPVQAASKRIKVISKQYVTVWTNYQSGRHVATHLKKGSSHFVYQTAKDSMGNLWYRIGKKEWVMAKYFSQVKTAKQAVKAEKAKKAKTAKKTKQTVKTTARSAASLVASWSAPMGSKARAKAVVALAKKQVGKAYVEGSKGPNAFDNASLVAYVYKQAAGVNTGSSTQTQVKKGIAVDPKSKTGFTEGDLLFWGSKNKPYNVAIYVGDGKYVTAAGEQQGVVQASLSTYFWPSRARRVL